MNERMKIFLKYVIREQKLWRKCFEKHDDNGCTRHELRIIALLSAVQKLYEIEFGEVPLFDVDENGNVLA